MGFNGQFNGGNNMQGQPIGGAPMQQPMAQPQGAPMMPQQGGAIPQGMMPQQTPVTPGKAITVRVNYEDGVEFQGLQGPTVIVATGMIFASVDQGSQYQTEQQVMGTVYRTAKEASKAFIQNFKDEADRQGGSAVMMAPTQVCMKNKEIMAEVAAKIEAAGIHVDMAKSSMRPTENKATKEAAQKAKAEREAAEQRRMDAQPGAEQYAQDAVLFEQNVPAADQLTGAKVAQLTAPFATGTARVEMRDTETRMVIPLQVSGVFTMDMSKFEPDYYAQKLQSTGDMVVQAINMQLMDRRDVSVLEIGKAAPDIAAKVAEQLRADGLDVVSVQIGRIAMAGKDKQKYDFRKKEMDRAKEFAADPNKAAEYMKQQMELARKAQIEQWKAQGMTVLQGAQQMAENAKKMIPSGKYPDGTEITPITCLRNSGFPEDIIAQAEAELAAGGSATSAGVAGAAEAGAGMASAAGVAQQAPQAPAQQAAPMAPANRPKFCMNCGKPLPPTGAFCQECGSRI